jgi:hypothetical protein
MTEKGRLDDDARVEMEIKLVQDQIKKLTESKGPELLPPVPMMPNLARGSGEMWQYYQYQQKIYDQLQNLPGEKEFLESILECKDSLRESLEQRLAILMRRETTNRPVLLQPITSVKPLSYQDKVERAKLIARHLAQCQTDIGIGNTYDPVKVVEQIKQLQIRLMDLEEQFLSA